MAFRKSTAVITSIAVAAVMFVMPLQVSASGTNSNYAGGAGYSDDPYLISNVQQFEYFRDQVNSGAARGDFFRLTADINLSGLNWTPIGTQSNPFSGNFDGGGHTVSNLTIGSGANPSGETYQGLFGYVGQMQTAISYLNVSDAAIYSGGSYAGVIAGTLGQNYAISLYDCHASGQIIASPGGGCNAGGLVGYIQDSMDSVNECSSSVSVTGDYFSTGGLVGVNFGIIKNSFSSGAVSSNTEKCGNADAFCVGGLVGSNCSIVENSYFTGTISDPYAGEHLVGEIVGSNDNTGLGAAKGSITNCYATFVPQSPMSIGGVTGDQESSASNSHNYWCTDGSYAPAQAVLNDSGITAGNAGMSAADMKAAAFITTLNTNASGQSAWHPWQAPAAGKNGGFPVLIAPGNNAELSSLKINGAEVSTVYASDTAIASRTYSISIPNNADTITVTPVAQDANANITVNEESLTNGSVSVTYYEGSTNQMHITVESPDNMRTCEYFVNVTKLPSSDATLSALTVTGDYTGSALSPAFDPSKTDYTMSVPYNATKAYVNATANHNQATVSINGGSADRYAYAEVPLGNAGTTTTIPITVTAQDSSQKTYTVNIKRETQSTRKLSSLGISSGKLSPAFSPDTLSYTLLMPTTATSVALTPVDSNYGDSITINNQSINSNGTATINLAPGTSTDINIYVQSHDGSYGTNSYDIHVTWEKQSWQDNGFVAAGFGGGSGTTASPYLIGTPGELAYLAQQVNAGNQYVGACFKLSANINLSGRYWVPIGDSAFFSGTFDGDGYTISNVAIGTETDPSAGGASGLFGYVGPDGVIRNLSVGASIYTPFGSGIVAGLNCGTIDGCSSSGFVKDSNSMYVILGGIAGENNGIIRNSYSSASLTDSQEGDVGGIAGDNYGEIVNCYSTGTRKVGGLGSIGGIAGNNHFNITNCYAVGNISAGDESYAGGIAGYSDADITNCYARCDTAVGDISSDGANGGVVGYTDGGNYTHDFWSLDAKQKVNGTARTSTALLGIGYGTDTTTGLHESAMADTAASTTFAQQLTAGRTDTSTQLQWKYVKSKNGGLPILDGVGDGAKTDAMLSALTVSAGTLSPAFSSSIVSYSVSVSSDTRSISLTPVTDDSLASVKVNGKTAASGHGIPVTLAANGNTNISVVVTAEDGATVKTYTVTVTRKSSPSGTQVVTDTGTGIRADIFGAGLPAGMTVSLRVSHSGAATGTYRAVVRQIGSNSKLGRLKGLTVYNIELLDQNGNPIKNFTGKIKVMIPIPAGMSGNLHVYWYDPASGTLTDMGATQKDGYLVFYTTHFSAYAVAQLDSSTPVENPKTGDESWPMLPLALLGGGWATGLFIVSYRKIFRRRQDND